MFCPSNKINHFLSCSEATAAKAATVLASLIVTKVPFSLTLTSSCKIMWTICRFPSTTGKQKAFSTCYSHFTVVSIFYRTVIIFYGVPIANQTPGFNKLMSVLYTVPAPVVNSIIYSLRNKEVKEALRRLFESESLVVYGPFAAPVPRDELPSL
ncbi:Olfactory receptor 11A1 [Chelonia mydas]|uniref:Olfactory receptor 11A1 n=1 Tax=Chelonia mydas TaxID=8469 RepID=M7B5Y0_CHEMY|nr:Olfactory receptor 11A1 [Chelonia mydas]